MEAQLPKPCPRHRSPFRAKRWPCKPPGKPGIAIDVSAKTTQKGAYGPESEPQLTGVEIEIKLPSGPSAPRGTRWRGPETLRPGAVPVWAVQAGVVQREGGVPQRLPRKSQPKEPENSQPNPLVPTLRDSRTCDSIAQRVPWYRSRCAQPTQATNLECQRTLGAVGIPK